MSSFFSSSRRRPSRQASETNQDESSSSSALESAPPVIQSPYIPAETPATSPSPATSEPRLCWICQQDETEDEIPNTVWKKPCPCTLVAHEACLLEWIANEEAPARGEMPLNHTIKCPQCQTEIQIERPQDYLVRAVEEVQRTARKLILPTAASALAGCFYSGLLVYGFNTMETVFGREEARHILGVVEHDAGRGLGTRWFKLFGETARWSLTALDPFFPEAGNFVNLKIFLGLPLVAPSLVISRTRFADQAFALLLPMYFLDPSHRAEVLDWPPPAGLAFAALPYLRSIYNGIYQSTISPYERKWDLIVRRKTPEVVGQVPQDGGQAPEPAPADQDDGFFGIEFRIGEEEIIEGDAPAANIPADQPGNQPGNPPDAAQQNDAVFEIRQDFTSANMVSTTMGALFFPTVASLMGELLKNTLPSKWVSPNRHASIGLRLAGRGNGGLLREKWGRTIVGGVLFIVLKDVVTLYCKWKKARDFGKRKILDYRGKGK